LGRPWSANAASCGGPGTSSHRPPTAPSGSVVPSQPAYTRHQCNPGFGLRADSGFDGLGLASRQPFRRADGRSGALGTISEIGFVRRHDVSLASRRELKSRWHLKLGLARTRCPGALAPRRHMQRLRRYCQKFFFHTAAGHPDVHAFRVASCRISEARRSRGAFGTDFKLFAAIPTRPHY